MELKTWLSAVDWATLQRYVAELNTYQRRTGAEKEPWTEEQAARGLLRFALAEKQRQFSKQDAQYATLVALAGVDEGNLVDNKQ